MATAAYPGAYSHMFVAYVQAAVYNAVASIDGGYEQYHADLARRPGASIDAAVATAAYEVLSHYFTTPAQQDKLNAEYAAALDVVHGQGTKALGVEVGHEAAAALISLRQGDGLGVDNGFTMPTPGPGVWQLPAGTGPQTPWLGDMRPFLIESPDQFRVGPPPALTSDEWARDFNEIKDMGGTVSAYRTPQQRETALFWAINPVQQSQKTLENLALTRNLDAMEAARLFAMADLTAADALIACWDAKYTYLFWRPQYAVPLADTDGNPNTLADTTWTPLLPVPNHPEYPSAHGCMTGSQAEVFAKFFDTDEINVDIFSTVDGQQVIHHFDRVADLQTEIANARIWGGLHYRFSMMAGLKTAQDVAGYALDRYFLPVEKPGRDKD